MLSSGMFTDRALSSARRSRKFASGSPPPARAATMISRATLVKRAPRLASLAPFWRLIVDHLECPDIGREYTGLECSDPLRPPLSERGSTPPMTMKSVDLPHLRSVVLAGHAGAGKTTRGEQLLHRAGAVGRVGRVDDGTSHLDFEPEEQKRRESLSGAVATFESDGTRITVVDTPGYLDFAAEMVSGFHAADGAIFVVDATGGVEAGLEQAIALGRGTGSDARLFLQQRGQGERRSDAGARRPPDRVRVEDRAAPYRDRRRAVVQRLRRPRPPQ